jgi:site-specific recombinase XerD
MIESGIELSFVQAMLGHSAISTTQIYTAIVQKTLKEKMKKMRY